MIDVLALHRDLVATPSVSKNEAAITDLMMGRLTDCEVVRLDHGIVAKRGSGRPVILNSHLDTVPPSTDWTRDPWTPDVVDGMVFGVGSNDAKASVAALTAAFLATDASVILILGHQEETTGLGTETCLTWVREHWLEESPVGAIVGEPTDLDIGTSQKGLLILELHAKGTSCHAARAVELGATNALYVLAEDLMRLQSLSLGPIHAQLGAATLQPTVIKGGDVHNRLAPEATVTLDVRTVPTMTHDALIALIDSTVTGDIVVRSKRLEPYACDNSSQIVVAAQQVRPASKVFGSATMSDQVFFRDLPCIKCGPGQSVRSHTADEFVLESEIVEATVFYGDLLKHVSRSQLS